MNFVKLVSGLCVVLLGASVAANSCTSADLDPISSAIAALGSSCQASTGFSADAFFSDMATVPSASKVATVAADSSCQSLFQAISTAMSNSTCTFWGVPLKSLATQDFSGWVSAKTTAGSLPTGTTTAAPTTSPGGNATDTPTTSSATPVPTTTSSPTSTAALTTTTPSATSSSTATTAAPTTTTAKSFAVALTSSIVTTAIATVMIL
ncbi:unnamed protein product [Aphanomyces euteiches]|uniref:Secreted protein n=1 Tax=Aphanomyces euteiches TaxID=100861 RepID=A0A6G0X6I0_9STRA|nr:hypothetical protein Ae201684_008022 [Aphanomyces euteiches]KAH9074653.1 hypothetical protein Ae201684P_022455 [Aphanomyces euteiches]